VSRVLVSFCNLADPTACALAIVDLAGYPVLRPGPPVPRARLTGVTGLAADAARVYAAVHRAPEQEGGPEESLLMLFDRRDLAPRGCYVFRLARDVHSLLAVEDHRLLAVSTGTDEVVELTVRGFAVTSERVGWRPARSPAGQDSVHLNSLAVHGEEILVSAFGRRTSPDWEGAKSGFVAALANGRAVIDGLSQPHSLVSLGADLLFCESGLGVIGGLERPKTVALPGYPRGLCCLGEDLLVGTSCWRAAARHGATTGCGLLRLRAQTGEVLNEFELNDVAREIYDLLPL
jgi:hypothetical protein